MLSILPICVYRLILRPSATMEPIVQHVETKYFGGYLIVGNALFSQSNSCQQSLEKSQSMNARRSFPKYQNFCSFQPLSK